MNNNKFIIQDFVIRTAKVCFIWTVIELVWEMLEILFYGEVQHQTQEVEAIISFISMIITYMMLYYRDLYYLKISSLLEHKIKRRHDNHGLLDIVPDNTKKFHLQFDCVDGNKGEYVGTTKEIREQLDNHIWNFEEYYHRWSNFGRPTYLKEWELKNTADDLSIVKFGYYWEWRESYSECEYTIDNSFYIKVKEVRE